MIRWCEADAALKGDFGVLTHTGGILRQAIESVRRDVSHFKVHLH